LEIDPIITFEGQTCPEKFGEDFGSYTAAAWTYAEGG
jgi:hypothetical protein